MAVNKIATSAGEALGEVRDGATVLVTGFGPAGAPTQLLTALASRGLRGLTVVANNAGAHGDGMEQLLASGAVRRLVCSYPNSPGSSVFANLYERGLIELELVPQGTMSERIRAAGAGIGAFYVRTSAGTDLGQGKEERSFGGHVHVLERPLPGDLALVRGDRADPLGNLVYNKSGRNFGPTMAMAASWCAVEVREVVPRGHLDPECIITPGVFVDSVVEVGS